LVIFVVICSYVDVSNFAAVYGALYFVADE